MLPRLWSRRGLWAAAVVLVIGLSLVTVTVTGPRVSVRWNATIDRAERLELERRHDLRNGRQDAGDDEHVWRYELGDWSPDAVAAVVRDPAVADTHYIDRNSFDVATRR